MLNQEPSAVLTASSCSLANFLLLNLSLIAKPVLAISRPVLAISRPVFAWFISKDGEAISIIILRLLDGEEVVAEVGEMKAMRKGRNGDVEMKK